MLLNVAIVIAALYFAKPILVPIALGLFFMFLLTPFVMRVERWGFSRVLAVGLVVLLSLSVIAAIGWGVAEELAGVTNDLPHYEANLKAKIQLLSKAQGSRLTKVMNAFSSAPARPIPVPVEVVKPMPTLLHDIVSPVLGPLGTSAIVIVFTILMLIKRELLRDKTLALMGLGYIRTTTQALDDASLGVSRYLHSQLTVNALYGLVVGVSLYFIGVPKALFWGVLAGLLRFIPYIGIWIAAGLAVLFSLAVFNGWSRPLLTLGFFGLTEFAIASFIEPWLYGARTGLSAGAVLLAAIFWTALWGPVGLLLSMPLSVCLLVLGRHFPQVEFLYILLSDKPIRAPGAHVYERLLAMDYEGAKETLETHLQENSLEDLYDSMLIPVLNFAKRDRFQDGSSDPREKFIGHSIRELIEELSERHGALEPLKDSPKHILCVPATDEADEIFSTIFSQLLNRLGHGAIHSPAGVPDAEVIEKVSKHKMKIVCIFALPPFALGRARALCKQLKGRFPEITVMACLWNFSGSPEKAKELLGKGMAQSVSTSLVETLDRVRNFHAFA